jgi:hypothetical protein
MTEKPRPRKTAFAVIAVLAGLLLVGFELAGASGTSTGERWFWGIVGGLLIVLGSAELAGWGRTPEA